ncbi:MAG: DoxX family protein [Rhizobiales bacterium]|nr:DoxX family protein [Hyphomicrobiales bacterium]
MNTGVIPASWSGPLHSILRIMTGLLFLAHGTTKLLGFPVSEHTPAEGAMATMTAVTGTLELVGGVLIVLGLFTRMTAFVLSGFMAVAYFMVHAPMNFHPINNHGELAIMFCFVFLYFAAAGGGPWSVDAKRP